MQEITKENPFIRLQGVDTHTATSIDDFLLNVVKNRVRQVKRFQELPTFEKVQGHDKPIALVGGGPSIKQELDNIIKFYESGAPIIACGSSHDWLLEHNIVPTYCAVCDPDPISIKYLKLKDKRVKYLIALSCNGDIFDYLIDQDVYAYHCASDDAAKYLPGIENEFCVINGGCTVGLRAISMAITLGYTNHHYWGFDSCMGDEEGKQHHAYEFQEEREKEGLGDTIHKLRLGADSPNPDKTYYCAGYQLAQAYHFHGFYWTYRALFTPTIHGEGLLKDYMELVRKVETGEIKLAT